MATQMPCAILTLENFCRVVQVPQNSKKFVQISVRKRVRNCGKKLPYLIHGREKGKLGMVWYRSNLQSTIYVAPLKNVLSRVMQDGKLYSSLNTFIQFPFIMLLFILNCLRSTRFSINQQPSSLRMFSYNSLKFN